MKTKKKPFKVKFIVAEETNPRIELKPGTKLQIETVELVDASLKPIKKGAARLCGGTTTCLALIDIED